MAIDWDSLILGPVMGVFGEEAVYTPQGVSPVTIPDAVFDEESADIQLGEDGQATTQRKPVLGIRVSALPVAPKQGDRVRITRTGGAYIVKEPIPDGKGHVHLTLQVAA